MEKLIEIPEFIIESFFNIWPYLLISIPLAVAVNLSGAGGRLRNILNRNALVSIILATVAGAISPLCSCSVVPVIASLLIGGFPLAPVMSFWIASPSMDPEVFFLSAATIGWKLSAWRLSATFVISISAGMITWMIQKRGFLGNDIMRSINYPASDEIRKSMYGRSKKRPISAPLSAFLQKVFVLRFIGIRDKNYGTLMMNCCVSAAVKIPPGEDIKGCSCKRSVNRMNPSWSERMIKESWKAFIMVAKFMLLAFFINALISFYLPDGFISGYIAGDGPFSVIIAALVGIPFYTSNAAALPLVGGFFTMGMNQGAALAFLIAGPVTTLPAMAAVWGIVRPKVFFLFLSFGLTGSVIFGYLYNLVQ